MDKVSGKCLQDVSERNDVVSKSCADQRSDNRGDIKAQRR